jgi:hypothetical protein
MLIYNVVAAVFCLILIGFVFLAILWVLNARPRHHRRDPGERREIPPLPDDDPVHSITRALARAGPVSKPRFPPSGTPAILGFSPMLPQVR